MWNGSKLIMTKKPLSARYRILYDQTSFRRLFEHISKGTSTKLRLTVTVVMYMYKADSSD